MSRSQSLLKAKSPIRIGIGRTPKGAAAPVLRSFPTRHSCEWPARVPVLHRPAYGRLRRFHLNPHPNFGIARMAIGCLACRPPRSELQAEFTPGGLRPQTRLDDFQPSDPRKI